MITPSKTGDTSRHGPNQSLEISGDADAPIGKHKTPSKMSLSVFGGRMRGMSKPPKVDKTSWNKSGGSSTTEEDEGEIIPAWFLLPIETPGKNKKSKTKAKVAPQSVESKDPAEFATYLGSTRMQFVDVARVKTLRMLLRHESTG